MGASADKIQYEDLEVIEEIGQGQFGTVDLVTFKKNSEEYFQAVAKNTFKLRENEMKVMIKLQHPNIVTVFGFCHKGPSDVILVEYAADGSLHDYLSDESKPLSYDLMKRWAKESAFAIQYLHKRNILHRSVKPQNCLLFSNNTLKLSEFGLVRRNGRSQTISSHKVTYRYMAPEILKPNEMGNAFYSKAAEIYAYGMLILEICSRRPPFHGMEYANVVFNVENGKLQPTIPAESPADFVYIMKRCWKCDPKQRPTIGFILSVLNGWPLVRKITPKQHLDLLQAFNIACCPNGDIVISSGLKKLYILDGNGKCKISLKTNETDYEKKIGMVLAITVSPLGHIFAVDSRRYVKVFDVDGKYLYCFSTLTADEDPKTPVNLGWITLDTGGQVVVDDWDRKMLTFHTSPEGKLVKRVKQESYGSMVVYSKNQIVYHFRPSGSVYTKVVATDYSGNKVFDFTPRIDEDMTDKKVRARGLVCDEDENIYIAMSVCSQSGMIFNTGHIQKYSPKSVFLKHIAKGLYNPCDMDIAPDGSLVVANQESVLIYALK